MRLSNGIAYADVEALRVVGVRALPGHRLWLRFSTGEEKTFDATPLLGSGVFAALADPATFAGVGVDYGVPTWSDVGVDLAPEFLYEKASPNL